MEKNFICVTYAAIWDQVVRVQPIWDQNARKEAGDKSSVSFDICELSAPLVSVKVSCYYPDFNLPCPPALVHLGLMSVCPIPGLQQGKWAAAASIRSGIRMQGGALGSPRVPDDRTGPLSTRGEMEPFELAVSRRP